MKLLRKIILTVAAISSVFILTWIASKFWIEGRYKGPLFEYLDNSTMTFLFNDGTITQEHIDKSGVVTRSVFGKYVVKKVGSYKMTTNEGGYVLTLNPGMFGLYTSDVDMLKLGLVPSRLGPIIFRRIGL